LALLLAPVVLEGAVADTAAPPIFLSSSGQFTLLKPISPAPDVSIRTLDGSEASLRQFRGKVVLLNFWATWCGPCVHELPSLDRLAVKKDDRLEVLAVSIDRDGAAAVAPFVRDHHLAHLAIYLDPEQRLGSLTMGHAAAGALRLWGLPISYLIDKEGHVIGYITGAADWDSPEAQRFLRYFISQAAQ
jgi:thiol-disulfide isomerase/thioredoxin